MKLCKTEVGGVFGHDGILRKLAMAQKIIELRPDPCLAIRGITNGPVMTGTATPRADR